MSYGLTLPLRKIIFLVFLAVVILLASLPALGRKNSEEGTVLTLDFAIAETLFEILDTPVAMGGVNNYKSWVGENSTPQNLVSIGTIPQPNKELISTINVSTILAPPQYIYLEDDLSRIAPVEQLSLYDNNPMRSWEKMVKFTKEIGVRVGREQEANFLISESEEHFSRLREISNSIPSPLLIIQFLDERHVRVYGENSLPGTVLDQLELDNAWDGPTNQWEFSIISISELFNYDVHLVIVDASHLPSRKAVQDGIMASGLWNRLPSVQKNNTTLLNANFWVFGAIPSTIRFADSLVNALDSN
ncbi:ABC transporter substrate-binding protein [Vreelandella sp. F11]|uniref:ABC transporter substrate-binding protein n=1 Tax=Vreelandella sp. F11 TaxID=3394751 RepID=UPI0036DC91DF